ncbi:hypothetical protein [Streptomyces sp. NPDC048277]|uniref:hypothetical protein n=1 Tax=Streptomyces sp. NPDC048277 TaxID=3155027 RepID=UPI0033E25643
MGYSDSLEDLHSLIILCPPPRNPGSYPSDYRELVHTYGTGCFDEFLWIFADSAPNSNLDIVRQTEQMRSTFRDKPLTTLRRVLSEHRAAPEDLVQWGVTDNGDVLAWIAVGEPDSWPTVIIQAGQLDAVVSPAGATTTLLGLLTGSLRVPFFPDDFPSSNPEFDENPYG